MGALTLDELLTGAQAMLAKGHPVRTTIAAASSGSTPEAAVSGATWRFYACGGSNHFARDCMNQCQESCALRQVDKERRRTRIRWSGGDTSRRPEAIPANEGVEGAPVPS
uniref:CCHC-type domain-containing protein n=1 Tax=Trichuris muris TaxID=70415 RepID=A0A5S6R1K3_TRIMR